jgi:DNA repair protein SbcD/Mre11
MRLVHASDLHLARPLGPLPLTDRVDLTAFRHASFVALTALIDLCLSERVSLLVLAGDLIDAWERHHQIGIRLTNELLRLEPHAIRVCVVRGNHDAESRVIRDLLWPGHVKELGLSECESQVIAPHGVMVHGRSYPRRATHENLLAEYPPPVPGWINVGVLHTSADGTNALGNYAPCGRRQLGAAGYQYFALGPCHTPLSLCHGDRVRYSGCLQGRSLLDSGPRGASLVELDAERVLRVEHRALDHVRFGALLVDVTRLDSLDRVCEAVARRAEEQRRRHTPRRLVARLLLSGETGVSAVLCHAPRVREQALWEAASDRDGHFWLESIWGSTSLEASRFRLDDPRGPRVSVPG